MCGLKSIGKRDFIAILMTNTKKNFQFTAKVKIFDDLNLPLTIILII